MKPHRLTVRCLGLLLTTMMVIIALTNCRSAPKSAKDVDISVQIELGQPVRLREPVPVTVTVETDEDIPNMQVFLSESDPTLRISKDPPVWEVDAVAHRPLVFTTTVEFIHKGHFTLSAYARDRRIERFVDDSISLYVTKEGTPPTPTGLGEAVGMAVAAPPEMAGPAAPGGSPTVSASSPPRSVVTLEALNRPIPDDGGWTALPLEVTDAPDEAWINEVWLKFFIDHPRPEELVIELVEPTTGEAVRLWEREPAAANDFYEGQFYRIEPIVIFYGLPGGGRWQLRVRDEVEGQVGTIEAATLVIRYETSAPLPDAPTFSAPDPSQPEPPPPPEPTKDSSGSIAPAAKPEKLAAGQVTATGYFYYFDRNDNEKPAAYTAVHLYDTDP